MTETTEPFLFMMTPSCLFISLESSVRYLPSSGVMTRPGGILLW